MDSPIISAPMNVVKSVGSTAANGFGKVGEFVSNSAQKGYDFAKDRVGDVYGFAKDSAAKGIEYTKAGVQNLADSVSSTANKSGMSDVFSKLFKFQSLDEFDLTRVIVLLLAAIVIIVVVFFLPKLNKSAKFMKSILDSKFVKFLMCCVLFYAFYQYDIEIFLIMFGIVFAIYWFHSGYTAEHYGPVSMAVIGEEYKKLDKVLAEKDVAVVRKTEHGELIVGDINEFKEEVAEQVAEQEQKKSLIDKLFHREQPIVEPATEEEIIEDTIKTVEDVAVVPDPFDSVVGNGNNTLEMLNNQQEIFDQRDFMIMPEMAEERQSTFNRICDCTRCAKPTSFVEQRVF